jgi:peptidoglycan hydrolase-like protein with peptidoglycan-binding domain
MNEQNMNVLVNIIGAVESGGQIYGNRRYSAYSPPYKSTPNEHTITLGWAQNYGSQAYILVSNIYAKDPDAFDKIDKYGIIKEMINGEHDWIAEKWNPTAGQKAVLIALIDSPAGHECQDELFKKSMKAYIADCEKAYTSSVPAIMMYCEIRHLGGLSAAKRIFNKLNKDYGLDSIMNTLKKDQSDTSNNNQVGDKIFWTRHVKCKEFIEKYAVSEEQEVIQLSKVESATKWMERMANDPSHGYDQIYRWGEKGDYDCSAAVITAYQQAGVPVKTKGATYTGNMLSAFLGCGFTDITSKINRNTGSGLKRGDVLLAVGHHTAMYCGNGKEVEASINENGKATGGKPGDQTGGEFLIRSYRNYPWTHVLRYPESETVTESTVGAANVLSKGSSGQAVKDLQTMLIALGYSCGTSGADGDFGSATEIALKAFQKAYGLVVDGQYGSKSQAALKTAYTGASYTAKIETVRGGSKGAAVLLLQEILKARGFYSGGLTWSCDKALVDAVKAYQKSRSGVLSVDGECGPRTWADLLGM